MVKNNQIKQFYTWKQLLLWTVIVKVTLFLIVFLVSHLVHFFYDLYSVHESYMSVEDWTPWLSFGTWDARHYSYLAEHGYSFDLASNAFYPLYPFCVWLIKLVVQNTLLSGYIVSTICSFVMMWLLYGLVSKAYGEKVAFYAGLFLLVFPTSFFFSIMYSEALFLMLILGFFYLWQRARFSLAALMILLLPLARPMGVLIIFPILAHAFFAKDKSLFPRSGRGYVLFVSAAIVGFLAYLSCMYVFTGSFWGGFDAQSHFAAGFSLTNLFHPIQWFVRNFIDINLVIHDYLHSMLDRLIFVAVLIALVALYRHEDRTLWFYTLVMALVPAFSGSFTSYSRYVLVLFPIAILLSRWLKERIVFVLLPLCMLQVLFLIMYSLNYWVA